MTSWKHVGETLFALRILVNSKYPPPKKLLRVTTARALYHETDLPFFATLLFGYVSWYSLSLGVFVLS